MPADFITQAPRDLAGWVTLFGDAAELPVLRRTALLLEELRPHEDDVDAHELAERFEGDPLFTIKLLAHVARLRAASGRESRGDPETVTEALVMLGIGPFFRAFGPQRAVEDLLQSDEAALEGLQQVLLRARRAARFAIGFAVHRMDHDAPVIHEAALLHDFAELLLWARAPALALQIQARQRGDATLRSAAVQREVLHVELAEVEHALMQRWRLPALLVQLTDDHAARPSPQLRTVQLALRVARHSAQDWNNAALPDDVHDVAELLTLSADATVRLLHDIDGDLA